MLVALLIVYSVNVSMLTIIVVIIDKDRYTKTLSRQDIIRLHFIISQGPYPRKYRNYEKYSR